MLRHSVHYPWSATVYNVNKLPKVVKVHCAYLRIMCAVVSGEKVVWGYAVTFHTNKNGNDCIHSFSVTLFRVTLYLCLSGGVIEMIW